MSNILHYSITSTDNNSFTLNILTMFLQLSAERKRYFEISRGSVIEIDTALDMAIDLKYCSLESLTQTGKFIISTFKQLTGLIGTHH